MVTHWAGRVKGQLRSAGSSGSRMHPSDHSSLFVGPITGNNEPNSVLPFHWPSAYESDGHTERSVSELEFPVCVTFVLSNFRCFGVIENALLQKPLKKQRIGFCSSNGCIRPCVCSIFCRGMLITMERQLPSITDILHSCASFMHLLSSRSKVSENRCLSLWPKDFGPGVTTPDSRMSCMKFLMESLSPMFSSV